MFFPFKSTPSVSLMYLFLPCSIAGNAGTHRQDQRDGLCDAESHRGG